MVSEIESSRVFFAAMAMILDVLAALSVYGVFFITLRLRRRPPIS